MLPTKINNNKKSEDESGINLYLKVHVMPILNKPLRGKPWHWIAPFVLAGIIIVALLYFLGS